MLIFARSWLCEISCGIRLQKISLIVIYKNMNFLNLLPLVSAFSGIQKMAWHCNPIQPKKCNKHSDGKWRWRTSYWFISMILTKSINVCCWWGKTRTTFYKFFLQKVAVYHYKLTFFLLPHLPFVEETT